MNKGMRSIGRYLKRRLVAGAAVVLLSGCVLLAVAMVRLNVREFDFALYTKADTLAGFIFEHEAFIEVDFLDEHLPEFERSEDPSYFQIYFINGSVAQRSPRLSDDNLPLTLDQVDQPYFVNLTLPDGRRGRAVQLAVQPRVGPRTPVIDGIDFIPVPPGLSMDQPYVILVLAWGRNQLDTMLGTIYGVVVGLMALLLLGIVAVVNWFVRTGFRPLTDMNHEIARLEPADLNQRVPLQGTPEELRLAKTALNGFLDRLQRVVERERTFIADVAHELRTPIAEIRVACDVGARWSDDPTMVQQRFAEMQQAVQQLEQKVNGLLELSRLEQSAHDQPLVAIPLRAFLVNCWEQTAEVFNPNRLRFDCQVPDHITIRSDEAKLQMIFLNLIRNALAYSQPDTVVRAAGQSGDNDVFQLELANQTGHVTREDLPHLFDRFWRKEHGAASSAQLGLGLSIVHALCVALHMEVSASLHDSETLKFTLILREEAG